MNVCLITKYPPIQGGVSAQCYWAARGLAERGHLVRVITNANEVEDLFRVDLSPEDLSEAGPYQPQFPDRGGRVDVDSTDRPDRSRIYYIPLGNPTVSRLVSRALRAVHDEGCDVVFAQYLEPYGLAASIVGAWTGTPYVFKHAGSDLFRLMDVPDLQPCYREVLCRAHRVITGGPAQQAVRAQGVSDAQIVTGIGFGIPKAAFNPSVPPANLNRMLECARSRWASVRDDLAMLMAPIEPGVPVLGMYGKLGEQKGTFDLLQASRLLKDQGFPFCVMVLGRGWQEGEFGRQVAELGLADHIRVHPFIPHWRIPDFIRACDAVAFLERDFTIQAHTPSVPSEVLSCGTCLIVSEEVLRKQMFRAGTRQRENLIVVADPRDHAELARAIRYALEDVDRARRVGLEGHRMTEDMPDVTGYVDGLERVLESVRGATVPTPTRARPSATSSQEERLDPVAVFERLYPYTTALLGPAHAQAARAALSGSMIGSALLEPKEFAVSVGERMLGTLATVGPACAQNMCLYELTTHAWVGEQDRGTVPAVRMPAFDLSDALLSARITLRGDMAIERFEYDVEELAKMIVSGERLPDEADILFRAEGGLFVLFHRGSFPQRISRWTAMLLMLLRDRGLTVEEIRTALGAELGLKPHDIPARDVVNILQGLFWEGIIEVDTPMTGSSEASVARRIAAAT